MPKVKNVVDIILPCYNSEKFIDQCIQSIQNQSLLNWRLIIIDDCSIDNTVKKIKKYNRDSRVYLIKLKKNMGAHYCRNLALKKINSKYIAFLDSDDLWTKDKLKLQIKFMEKYNHNFTYTDYYTFKNNIKNKKKIISDNDFTLKKFIFNTGICTSSMIIRKKIIGNSKFSNTKICEDYYFKCQILKKEKKAIKFNKLSTYYRISNNSMQSNKLRNIYWVWYINNRFNKLGILQNFKSLFYIGINSLKRYGLK